MKDVRVRELLVCLYVYVFRCHACHADCTSMSPSATPATQSEGLCVRELWVKELCVCELCVTKLCV